MIEGGGVFIDYRIPNKIYKTTDPKEWNKHLIETKATVSGYTPCPVCGNQADYEDAKVGTKPLCDSCKKEAGQTKQ